MSILITGGTGFLGRHLVRHMLEAGEKEVIVLDAVPNLKAIADIAPQIKVAPGDVLEVTALIDTINKYKVEGIIHLAYLLGTGGIRNPLGAKGVGESPNVGGVPAFYVNRLSVRDGQGRELASLHSFEPVSENPVFSFDFAEPPDGGVRIVGTDNNGNRIASQVE